jgi:hypothetical protein
MNEIKADVGNIAFCGLYCGACGRYLKGKCPGCHNNEKASWCKIRSCCLDNNYQSCADCKTYSDPNECKYFNNFMAKLFGLIFGSNRNACISYISNNGYEAFAKHMAENKLQSLKK